jgi:hypothetical protein
MSRHLHSAVLPGALLALLVTCGSLLALVLVIGPRSDQDMPTSFGADESTVTLRGTSDASSDSTRVKAVVADVPLLSERDAAIARGLAAGLAPDPTDASAARSSRPAQPRAVLRGTTRRRSTRRPAAQPPAPTSPPASVPAVAAVPVVAAPAATPVPEAPTWRHPTRQAEGRTPPRGDHDRRRHPDRRHGPGNPEPDTPAPPVPAPVPPAATPDPQSPGEGQHRRSRLPWGHGEQGGGGRHRGDRGDRG